MTLILVLLGVAAAGASVAEWPLNGSAAFNDSNVAFTLASAFAFLACAAAVRRCAPRELRTWTSIAIANGAWLAGQIAWDVYSDDGRTPPVPSAADFMWLAFPLIAGFGIYRFAPVLAAVRRVIDLDAVALAVGAGGLTIALNYHGLANSTLSVAGRLTTLAYPTLYSAVVALGAGAIVGTPEVLRRKDLMLVYAGLVLEGIGFGFWCPEVLRGTYVQGGSLLDLCWTAGLILMGAGALVSRRDVQPIVYAPDRLRRRTVLPALSFVGLAAVLLAYGVADRPFPERLPLLIALCAVGAVLIARGWLAFAAVEGLEADRRETLARRNRELEAFAYSASHDLKAPLVSIAGFAGMLERSLGERLGEDETYYLQRINANAEGLQQLIADLFAFARSGEDERSAEPVDTNVVAAELVDELRDRAEARGMALVVDGPLPAVRAHPIRLKQALTNLVDNALRYGAGDVRVSGSQADGVARIVVEDGGAGVPIEERDRIFEVFARGRHARLSSPEGTGLGLALVKRIVEASGGDVRYEPGAGARFVLSFPGGAR